MSEQYLIVVPNFGLHHEGMLQRGVPIGSTLKDLFDATPSAAVGEIGLDKGSKGKQIDFTQQVQVFQQQLELAKVLKRPASIHCGMGPFPDGIILHSYLVSAEMVPEFAKLGDYFSFSGFLMDMKATKAKKMLKMVLTERILLETDAPDALPKSTLDSLHFVDGDPSFPEENQGQGGNSTSDNGTPEDNPSHVNKDTTTLPRGTLNHPANIYNVLDYVASLLEMPREELAEVTYNNAVSLFSYEGGIPE